MTIRNYPYHDFPGAIAVKNLPAKASDAGLILGLRN